MDNTSTAQIWILVISSCQTKFECVNARIKEMFTNDFGTFPRVFMFLLCFSLCTRILCFGAGMIVVFWLAEKSAKSNKTKHLRDKLFHVVKPQEVRFGWPDIITQRNVTLQMNLFQESFLNFQTLTCKPFPDNGFKVK